MKKSNCFPPPTETPILALKDSDSFSPSQSKSFQTEIYWNIESASIPIKQYLLSLILPIYLASTSLENLTVFLDYYIYGNQGMSKHLMIAKDRVTQEIEGIIVLIELQNFYYLENDFTKENSYVVYSGVTIVKKGNRRKGISQNMHRIYKHVLSKRHIGRNTVFFEIVLNPNVYLYFSKNFIIYPSYKYFASFRIKEFLVKISVLFQENIEDINNPFCVYDGTVIKDIDREYLIKNYDKLPKDIQFFIDQTKLNEGYGIVFLEFGSLLAGNTLGLPPCSYTNLVLPDFDVKEYSFLEPKL